MIPATALIHLMQMQIVQYQKTRSNYITTTTVTLERIEKKEASISVLFKERIL